MANTSNVTTECTELADFGLIKACIKGEREAWGTFVECYSRAIHAAIHKTYQRFGVNTAMDEEKSDLFQEVFLHLKKNDCQKLKSFEGKNGCSLATWLRVVVSRLVIDHLRRERPCLISIDDAPYQDGRVSEYHSETEAIAEERIEALEVREFVRREMAALSPRDRFLISLVYEDGLAIEEVSRVVNLTAGAIYTRISRIKGKLRKSAQEAGIL
jgi:RNA polymerase sigma-70 factor, ECF subfamily